MIVSRRRDLALTEINMVLRSLLFLGGWVAGQVGVEFKINANSSPIKLELKQGLGLAISKSINMIDNPS